MGFKFLNAPKFLTNNPTTFPKNFERNKKKILIKLSRKFAMHA